MMYFYWKTRYTGVSPVNEIVNAVKHLLNPTRRGRRVKRAAIEQLKLPKKQLQPLAKNDARPIRR